MKMRRCPPKSINLAVICFLISTGIVLPGCHLFSKQDAISDTEIEKTTEMVENVIYYENGEHKVIDTKSEGGIGMVSLLTRKLHELNSQAVCIFSEGEIQEIKQKDRCVELIFRSPMDVTISQWIEPEERYHIPVDERGYRILGINNALFIMEDNLGEALGAHILTGHEYEGSISYGGWAIQSKRFGKTSTDESWVDSLDKILSELP